MLVCICGLIIAVTGEARDASPAANAKSDGSATRPPGLAFSAEPADAEIFNARVFDEPLVPSDGRPRSQENRALAAALEAYANRATQDDCSSLVSYLEAFPNSRWSGPLLLHLGTEYYNYGYFSRALDAWERAWKLFQNVHYSPAKAEADRALGELARIYSKLGRMAQLSQLLQSTKDRDLDGPATQLIHAAKDALWMMENKPDYCFQCGPLALDRILRTVDPSKAGNPLLQSFKSPTNGFALPEVAGFSRELGMRYRMAFRSPGAPVIIPSVVHWNVGHYAALIERRDERIMAQDYTFRSSVWLTTNALDQEASGYFLVPDAPLPAGWRSVSSREAQVIRGKGFVSGPDPNATGCHDTTCGGSSCGGCRRPCHGDGMTTYTMHALLASLTLNDTPLRFFTPFGPQVAFTATYNQLEANQPATFPYSNLGSKWTCNWISFITDNPGSTSADVALYEDGGGTLPFTGFTPATQSFAVEAMSHALLTRLAPASYELLYPNGARRDYAQSDGSVGSSRRIFLTRIVDPSGNAVQLNYDSQFRITNIVNAINQATTLSYTNAAYPNAITSVTDPFGRTAYFQYNSSGLLTQTTDVLGLTSQYTYGANQFINALTTPYGTTTFVTGSTNGGTFLTATDPLGATELVEYSQSSGIPHSLPASQVPHGLSTFNLFIDGRDSLFWDKKAYAEGAWDWTKAKIYHWLHQGPSGNYAARILESEKSPLDARVWYNYPGQSTNYGSPYYLDAAYTGASDQPSAIARVLDDGTTQLSTFARNFMGNVTNYTDPVGRNYSFIYASNNVDLLDARMTHNGKNELLQRATYNPQHHPLTLTDAAGQTDTFTYDSRGQILTMTNPKNETVTFGYDSNAFLVSVQGPLAGTNDTVKFTYDAFNRMHTFADTEGYTVTLSYDAFDRPILKSFPDGTSEQLVYNRLDLVAIKDRLGRWATNTYNADRQLVSALDPLGRLTRFEWCKCGLIEAIIDPMGRETSWTYDVQSRPVAKQFPDGSIETFTYESAGGRLRIQTDANGQQAITDYYLDNSVKSVSYLGGANPAPSVSFTYDPDYDRVLTMQDSVGTTVFSYNPITAIPSLGASQLQSVSGPLPNSAITYQYDQLGRIISRAINGSTQTVTFDVLGRATNMTSSLGSFRYAYLNATMRLTSAVYPNGLTTLYSWYDNTGDQRLKQILHLKPNSSLLSSFGYAYNAVGQITSLTNAWDSLPSRVWLFNYDAANQILGAVRTDGLQPLSTNSYAYDFAGNRTMAAASGATNSCSYNAMNQMVSGASSFTNGATYEWDSAHRLTAINNGSHRSEFSYDGLDRRIRIVEKQNGAVTANNTFLWCGNALCEERDATGATVVRRFFSQGESLLGTGTTNLFYTRDHLASIREALDSAATIQTRYDYDPYGQQTVLAENIPASFAYTGHFQHKPSGLYLAQHRELDPRAGRWLNRDPIEEAGGLNLYAYVNNDPLRRVDPLGLCDDEEKVEPNEILEKAAEKEAMVETGIRIVETVVHHVEHGEPELSAKLLSSGGGNIVEELNDLGKHGGAAQGVAVVGAVVSTGFAVVDDYHNGAGVILTATDASSTFVADVAVSACPPVAMANLVTGGVPSALIHNALATPNTIGRVVLMRTTSRDQQAIKKIYTRNWATAALWKAGEWLADKIVSDAEVDCP